MKKILVAVIIVVLANINLIGQNLIGYSEKEVRQYMADKEKDMTFQNFINNSTFKYLKYANSDETITLLFFLNEDSICKSVRLVCDKSLKADEIKKLDSNYKKIADNQWTETKNGKNYLMELKEEEWSFNITIKLNE